MLNRFYTGLLVLIALLAPPALAQDRAVPESRAQVQLSFAPLVKKTAPAVVNIYTRRTVSRMMPNPFAGDPFFAPFFRGDAFGGRMRQQAENALGSGAIVDPEGLVITNAHVVRDADQIAVVLADGREFEATLALKDDASDLALLRIDTAGEALPHITLKPSETLEVGDIVLAIGNPFGVGQTVTSGIVSAQGRSSLNINDYNFFIQTDAAINPGNSGGPLVALDGGVVGINTAIFSKDGGSLGIGFAIPSEMVASVIQAEKAGHGTPGGVVRGWLGVSVQGVTPDIASSLGMKTPHGALISALHPASPLKKAGMKVGDAVLAVGEHTIKDPSEMKFRMAVVPIGQSVSVKALRAGKTMEFSVTAAAAPDDPPREALSLDEAAGPLGGATVANMNPAVAIELGIPAEAEGGVVVLDIVRGAPASRLLARGDLLLEINGQKITRSADVQKALKAGRGRGLALVKSAHGEIQQIIVR